MGKAAFEKCLGFQTNVNDNELFENEFSAQELEFYPKNENICCWVCEGNVQSKADL